MTMITEEPSIASEVIGDQEWIMRMLLRSQTDTAEFSTQLQSMPVLPETAPKSRAREVFEHFSSGDTIAFPQVILGLRALGIRVREDEARSIFDEADRDGSGRLEVDE